MQWTEEQVAEAKRLAGDGWSGSQIGRKLGCSRSAVIGKLNRLNVDITGQKLHFFANGKLQELERIYFSAKGWSRWQIAEHFGCSIRQVGDAIERIRKKAGIKRGREHAPSRIPQRVAARAADTTRAPNGQVMSEKPLDTAILLLDLARHHCRWPVGEATGALQLFCGADNLGQSFYCAAHSRTSRASSGYHTQQVVA